jgi:secreted PhoX family phosphatase
MAICPYELNVGGMMFATRRKLLGGLSAAAVGFAGLKLLGTAGPTSAKPDVEGYGPLVADPARLLDLPRGFGYRIVSREGEAMSDGLRTPAAFDGMAAFPVRGRQHQVASAIMNCGRT